MAGALTQRMLTLGLTALGLLTGISLSQLEIPAPLLLLLLCGRVRMERQRARVHAPAEHNTKKTNALANLNVCTVQHAILWPLCT